MKDFTSRLNVSRYWMFAVASIIALSACSLIGGYNAKSLEYVTSTKAAHMKFIDTFTEGENRSFSTEKLTAEVDKIDLKFREALVFANTLDDKLRISNIKALKEIFEEDVLNIKDKGRLLTEIEANTLSSPSGYAYDRAIKGECTRPNGQCK